ncbi:MAG: FHIPEP family type III secretion protein, partial [Dongiaceae bacterium]
MADAALQAAAATGTSPAALFARLSVVLRRGEIALALGVICILAVLILPMPPWLLDISLALSITVSVLVLMTALFISRPLDFSTFPTVLLITTMLRLSLNLA